VNVPTVENQTNDFTKRSVLDDLNKPSKSTLDVLSELDVNVLSFFVTFDVLDDINNLDNTVSFVPFTTIITNFTNISKRHGEMRFLLVPQSNSNATFIFTSSNPSVARIDGHIVTILKAGTTNIKASQLATTNYTAGEKTVTLTVSQTTATNPLTLDTKDGVLHFMTTKSRHASIVNNVEVTNLKSSSTKVLTTKNRSIKIKRVLPQTSAPQTSVDLSSYSSSYLSSNLLSSITEDLMFEGINFDQNYIILSSMNTHQIYSMLNDLIILNS
jgi:hypothetical protein